MATRFVEQDERAARVVRLESLAREIAAAWGNEWTARTHEDAEIRRDGYVYLCHVSDSRRIVLSARLYEPIAKIEVYGKYVTGPDYLGLGGHMNNKRPSISVSLDRPGAALAKDIARRFLPEYTRVFTDILAVVIAHQEAWDKKLGACDRLSALTLKARRNGSHDWRGVVDGRVYLVGSTPQIDLTVENLSE